MKVLLAFFAGAVTAIAILLILITPLLHDLRSAKLGVVALVFGLLLLIFACSLPSQDGRGGSGQDDDWYD